MALTKVEEGETEGTHQYGGGEYAVRDDMVGEERGEREWDGDRVG